jgi:hypothetical protein
MCAEAGTNPEVDVGVGAAVAGQAGAPGSCMEVGTNPEVDVVTGADRDKRQSGCRRC